MKKSIILTALVICAIYAPAMGAETGGPLVDPLALAGVELPVVTDADHRAYLGVPSGAGLSLGQIKAERLIVVVFNAFCSICQADAPLLKMVYQIIEDDPSLKGKTKVVGIATGNTQMEVDNFRKAHDVPFPLFADPDFALDRAISSTVRVPLLITASVSDDRSLNVLKTHQGQIKNVDALLERPVRTSLPEGQPRMVRAAAPGTP